MDEYTINQNYENSANERKRNILETHIGRKFLKKIEFGYEALLRKIDEDLFEE